MAVIGLALAVGASHVILYVHGEAHLSAAKLARAVGVPEVVLCGDGDLVRLAPDAGVIDEVPANRLYKDGALLVPAEAKKPGSPVQRKRKIAKSRPAQPAQFAQRPQMQVAQQSHFGFFGGSNWNSTW